MNNKIIRLTKEFRFEAAHALWNYDGLCRNIHGHSYILQVTIKGTPCANANDPKLGMVMDFSDLKKIVKHNIVSAFDHALIVNAATPHKELSETNQMFGKVLAVPYQPTCENMIADFADRIMAQLPEQISLHSLRLFETSSSFAEWYAEDQTP
ncbi:MAG TPA: 6-carboxytetrahydropterin synthase QueD [Bacteroidales bacterium]|nr:6-carboxytetrahydropterin synthase QueD [Bacteroidales bacterium]